MPIPDSARHEIHQQPGGYVGDPIGGLVYHYAVTLGFRGGTADHDENHLQNALNRIKPADGQVRRILDMGCGTGQSTTALKMRFPDAEVWGIDIAAPMVRYAHYRAAKMGLEVNFRQADSAKTGFPDGYFDMVCEHLMFHEASVENGEAIVKEAGRLVRLGGTMDHSDMGTRGNPQHHPSYTVPARARAWETQRRNNYEPHWNTYANWDFPAALRRSGFEPKYDGPPGVGSSGKLYAIKRA
jgi:ubiquinone/menaquinone biosynthesis C-methylase UbiE